MKKKLMTLQQHRLLKEAGQLIAFSERLKHAQKEIPKPGGTGRKAPPERESCKRTTRLFIVSVLPRKRSATCSVLRFGKEES